jgi:hypothetical protein
VPWNAVTCAKDNTSGCTAEACAFRDGHETFTDAEVVRKLQAEQVG